MVCLGVIGVHGKFRSPSRTCALKTVFGFLKHANGKGREGEGGGRPNSGDYGKSARLTFVAEKVYCVQCSPSRRTRGEMARSLRRFWWARGGKGVWDGARWVVVVVV